MVMPSQIAMTIIISARFFRYLRKLFKALIMHFPYWLQRILTALSLSLSVWTSAVAQKEIQLSNTTERYRIDEHVSIFIDSLNNVSLDQILSPVFQKQFLPSNDNLIFGYNKYPIWLKVKMKTLSPKTDWYLEIPAPFLEYVDFFQRNKKGAWIDSQSGYYRKQSLREIQHTGHVLPLLFHADSVHTTYIRIAGLSPKTFPVFIVEKETFFRKIRNEDIGYGIFFGILIVMFFYNLMLGIALRQTNYFLYIGTIVCTFLIFCSASGYGGRFLWPENPETNYYLGRLSLPLMSATLAIFTIRFLDVKKYSRGMYHALRTLVPLAVIALILIATKTLPSAGNHLITLSTIIYMASGIVCALEGNKTARYFTAAWSIYLLGAMLLTLRNSGVFEFNFWTTHLVEIGAVLQTIIIAFALGEQYRKYKLEMEEMQELAFRIQQDANDRLDTKVKERTQQLSKALEELKQTLDTNTHQTKIIENKNAELDSFFYRISHDLKGPVSSLLGLSTLAKREVTGEKAQEYIDRQHQQVERLNHIITGLIDLTQLNHQDLKKERIDFTRMIEDCLASFTEFPNFSSLTIRKNIPQAVVFYSEWTLVNAILQNLIENAIKYSQVDAPFVDIRIKQEQDEISIQVEDNGQGIPVEHHEKIFDMFYRASHTASGRGLGLYILKRSVDRLNGIIEIKSEPGIGSTFTVRLPASIHPN